MLKLYKVFNLLDVLIKFKCLVCSYEVQDDFLFYDIGSFFLIEGAEKGNYERDKS